jgi:hypothetical protein
VLREATIFMVIGALAMVFLVKHPKPASFVGLALGMVFYVGLIALLSKFGYERQSFRQARDRRRAVATAPATSTQPTRQRPAPTRRTSTGPSQRPNRSTKKKRR